MKVPFLSLQIPTRRIKKRYLAAVSKLLDRGNFVLTPEVEDFERAWAKAVGVKHCVGVSSGADALYLALYVLGIGPGDEVITQGNAYNATVTAILRTGAKPRFADIRPDTLTLDTEKIETLVNKKTKAILPVHLYGQPNKMNAISAIAKKHHLAVVEDCAQAHLAEYSGKMAGAWGNVNAFSFYPTKNLGAFGDAGAVTTDDQGIYERLFALRNLGQTAKNDHRYFGFNFRMDPLQAIVLALKLKFLAADTERRRVLAEYYNDLIKEADLPVTPPISDHRAKHVYYLYVIQLPQHDRDKLRKELAGRGIETAIHYPLPVYRQPFYNGDYDCCPIAEKAMNKIISLPFFLGIKKRQQEYVVEAMTEMLK